MAMGEELEPVVVLTRQPPVRLLDPGAWGTGEATTGTQLLCHASCHPSDHQPAYARLPAAKQPAVTAPRIWCKQGKVYVARCDPNLRPLLPVPTAVCRRPGPGNAGAGPRHRNAAGPEPGGGLGVALHADEQVRSLLACFCIVVAKWLGPGSSIVRCPHMHPQPRGSTKPTNIPHCWPTCIQRLRRDKPLAAADAGGARACKCNSGAPNKALDTGVLSGLRLRRVGVSPRGDRLCSALLVALTGDKTTPGPQQVGE